MEVEIRVADAAVLGKETEETKVRVEVNEKKGKRKRRKKEEHRTETLTTISSAWGVGTSVTATLRGWWCLSTW